MRNNDLLKYAGLATQMIATLGVAIFVGHKLDVYFEFKFPVLLLLLSMASLVSMFWKVYNDSKKIK